MRLPQERTKDDTAGDRCFLHIKTVPISAQCFLLPKWASDADSLRGHRLSTRNRL